MLLFSGARCRRPASTRLHTACYLACLFTLVLAGLCTVVSPVETVCHSSGKLPFTPFALDLCYMHSHRTCCLSGYDYQLIRAAYLAISPNGAGCKNGNQRVYSSLYALRQYLCLPCDPREPSYRFRSVDGDVAEGGIVPPSPNSDPSDFTWRICRSFLYGLSGTNEGLWGTDGSRYNECGLMLQMCPATPIFNVASGQFTLPPKTCAADAELTLPSVAFKDAGDPGLEVLLRVAQTMPDFQIVVVNDSDPNFDYEKTPCFGRSNSALPAAPARLPGAVLVIFFVLGHLLN